MSEEYTWIAVYSTLILIFSMLGGYLPFLGRVSHNRLQVYLSLSAGVMLGASFFHVMPEAMEHSGALFGWWMSLGVVGLFCIERFIAPHSHELDGGHHHHHHDEHSHAIKQAEVLGHHHAHDHSHDHTHVHEGPKEHRAAAPAVAGWMAVLGLTIHTFMNGVGLAALVHLPTEHSEVSGFLAKVLGVTLPGISMFLAIVLHKPADALAISMVLSRKGVRPRIIALVQFGFGLMVPIGAATFYLTESRIQEGLKSQLTGAALAFSAGTFLFIALSDLLPEVQFHKHDRVRLFLCLLFGVVLMGGIALLEPHSHGAHHDEDHDHGGEVKKHDNEHDEDHEETKGHRDTHHH
jgi:zinc and cadmium transporter